MFIRLTSGAVKGGDEAEEQDWDHEDLQEQFQWNWGGRSKFEARGVGERYIL